MGNNAKKKQIIIECIDQIFEKVEIKLNIHSSTFEFLKNNPDCMKDLKHIKEMINDGLYLVNN